MHLFAVNPSGGPPDHRSSLGGRVRNVDAVVSSALFAPVVGPLLTSCALQQPMPTDLCPLMHLRVPRPLAAVAMTFVPPAHAPLFAPILSTGASPLCVSPGSASPQDVLLFDPAVVIC